MLTPDFATPKDLAHCRMMIKQGSKSFHLASMLLPDQFRQHARALYGFCRMADDLVDETSDARNAVAQLAKRLDAIYAGAPLDNPTDRAFADVVWKFAIPRAVPDALIEGFVWDAQGRQYQTLADVTAYGVRVAGTVGVMMSLIMGERRPDALARAIDLGVAMQFSNIARDVEQDAKLGRCYLPADWIDRAPAAAASQLVWEAETIYDRAGSGIAMLPRRCRAAINAARMLYRAIGLEARERRHKGRAIVSTARKFALVAKAVGQTPFLAQGKALSCLPEGQFLIDAVMQTPVATALPKTLDNQISWVMKMLLTVEARRS